jgi:hypothetical protein
MCIWIGNDTDNRETESFFVCVFQKGREGVACLPECSLHSDSGGQRGEDADILLFKPYTLYYNLNV